MTSSPYTYLTTHLPKYCTEEGPGYFWYLFLSKSTRRYYI